MDETLRAARSEIEELAVEDGEFCVACAETGERPPPVTGARFANADDARRAAALAREYRDGLREHDPDLPRHRFVVSESAARSLQFAGVRERTDDTRANGLPRTSRSVVAAGDGEGEWLRMANAPLVHLTRNGDPVGDDAVGRQLDSKL
ncbi:DUF7552 domain-containing protein [Halomicrococcus sp. NG-SE-24]|uniref:DUF7552 domain-containing protein n=1 Tax=Halomicrococcus sp. NG-SE-24 TaxID=3436928 RepID=UPI003D9A09FE